MKTISLFAGLALFTLIIGTACRKATAHSGSGYWYYMNQKHLVNYTSRKDSGGILILTAMETLPAGSHPLINSISILFGSTPTADSASFQTADPVSNTGTLTLPGQGQYWVMGTTTDLIPGIPDTCNGYTFMTSKYAAPTDTITFSDQWRPAPPATVTVANNKISITIPPLRGFSVNRCGIDSPTVYGFIQEQ